ncbi:MAG UNVERIFIED_CONTAM: molybdate ABC transporter substrate-binding protein [Planctomycetaceae bacterium]|jgi:molybdenum ABC transporter molybdate-binding protein
MSRSTLAIPLSLTVLAACVWLLSQGDAVRPRTGATQEVKTAPGELLVFCAASNRSVVEAIRKRYEAETGRSVQFQYGPSQALLSQLELTRAGDLFLPADDSYLDLAQQKGFTAEVLPLGRMRCGLVVPKGNPHGIDEISDLFSEALRVVQASPESAAVGRLTREALLPLGLWEPLNAATDAYRTTVGDVANDVRVGAADVGIVFDVVLYPFPDLEFIAVPQLDAAVAQVSVAVTSATTQPTAALHFARYLAASDRGLEEYQRQGFQVVTGDTWADVPELTVYAGSMLRPAIEETLIGFEEREGVRISRTYNGCGILVAQMKAGQHPDAYFACDVEFMKQMQELFPNPVNVSENELVILVHKGNPQNIASLKDLTKPGLRVGIGHEKQCAMGWITQRTFDESGLKTQLMQNVTVQTPTGDMLVNQLRTGSLDAAVAYLSNAAGAADFLDAVQIQGIPCAVAVQPWAVSEETRYPLLAGRLFDRIRSAESQEIFAAEGFRWQLNKPESVPAEALK